MQRYLDQLLADIEQAAGQAPDESTLSLLSEPDPEEEAVFSARTLRPADLFGLSIFAFPPAERLNETQLQPLLAAIEQLWQAWNISWECPPGLPAVARYQIMVHYMTREIIPYHPTQGARVDFCARRAQNSCPFGSIDACFCRISEDLARRSLRSCQNDPGHIETLYEWLQHDLPPHLTDAAQDHARWQQLMEEEGLLDWLYFYRPDVRSLLDSDESGATDNYLSEQNTDSSGLEWDEDREDRDFDIEFPY